MAEEEQTVMRLRDDFYRDGYFRAMTILVILLIATGLLVLTSLYLFFAKPSPVGFSTADEFRIVGSVPTNVSYPPQPDLLQWVSNALQGAFTIDFRNYNDELKKSQQYFTENGWKKFSDQLNIYAGYQGMLTAKLFLNASAAGAPIIDKEGLLPEKIYGWWIKMPINLNYSGAEKGNTVPIVIEVLVIRVSTINNLTGVAIDNLIVSKGSEDQLANG